MPDVADGNAHVVFGIVPQTRVDVLGVRYCLIFVSDHYKIFFLFSQFVENKMYTKKVSCVKVCEKVCVLKVSWKS